MNFLEKLKLDYVYNRLDSNSIKSKNWFVKTMSQMYKYTPSYILGDSAKLQEHNLFFGRLCMFIYDPKTKEKLPYYDTFPLVLPFEPRKDGFLGLNFHYIDPYSRAILLNQLSDGNNMAELLFVYRDIKNNPIAKSCLKYYLYPYVRTKFVEIEPADFEWVLYLPTERFIKKSKSTVWANSRNSV